MKHSLWKTLLLASVLTSVGALAESSHKLLRPKKIGRRVASLETNSDASYSETEEKSPKASRSFYLRLGLTAGMGTSSGSEVATASESGEVSDSGISFGLSAELTAYRYFGAELEATSGLKANQATTVGAENPFTQTRSRTVSSAMANLKAQVPFQMGGVKVIPKAGLGFGLTQLNEAVSLDTSSTQTQARLNVPYVIGGLEIVPARRWVLFVDFAKSIGGSGVIAFSNSESEEGLKNVGLTRLRASVAYRLSPAWSVGGQFIRRSLGFSQPLGDGDVSSVILQNQFLGLVQLDL